MNSQIKRYIGLGMGKGHGASKSSLGMSPSQYLHVVTNLDALQAPSFRGFMEVLLHRCS